MDKSLIFLLVFLSLFFAFGIGFFIGLFFGIMEVSDDEDGEENLGDLYCFQCEMEMSTKVKNGNLHCGNCGLKHHSSV